MKLISNEINMISEELIILSEKYRIDKFLDKNERKNINKDKTMGS